jgi:hypothetical protein
MPPMPHNVRPVAARKQWGRAWAAPLFFALMSLLPCGTGVPRAGSGHNHHRRHHHRHSQEMYGGAHPGAFGADAIFFDATPVVWGVYRPPPAVPPPPPPPPPNTSPPPGPEPPPPPTPPPTPMQQEEALPTPGPAPAAPADAAVDEALLRHPPRGWMPSAPGADVLATWHVLSHSEKLAAHGATAHVDEPRAAAADKPPLPRPVPPPSSPAPAPPAPLPAAARSEPKPSTERGSDDTSQLDAALQRALARFERQEDMACAHPHKRAWWASVGEEGLTKLHGSSVLGQARRLSAMPPSMMDRCAL